MKYACRLSAYYTHNIWTCTYLWALESLCQGFFFSPGSLTAVLGALNSWPWDVQRANICDALPNLSGLHMILRICESCRTYVDIWYMIYVYFTCHHVFAENVPKIYVACISCWFSSLDTLPSSNCLTFSSKTPNATGRGRTSLEFLEAFQADMSKIWELWFRCIHNSLKKLCILTSIFSLFYVCPPVIMGFPPHSENQNRTWNWIVKHSVEVWCSFSNTWRRLGIPRVVYATGQQGVEYITKMPVRTGTRTGHSWHS